MICELVDNFNGPFSAIFSIQGCALINEEED